MEAVYKAASFFMPSRSAIFLQNLQIEKNLSTEVVKIRKESPTLIHFRDSGKSGMRELLMGDF